MMGMTALLNHVTSYCYIWVYFLIFTTFKFLNPLQKVSSLNNFNVHIKFCSRLFLINGQ